MKKCVENILISGVKTLSHLILCSFVKYLPQGHLQGSFYISHSNWFAVTWSTVKIIWGHHNFFKNSILSSLVPSVQKLLRVFTFNSVCSSSGWSLSLDFSFSMILPVIHINHEVLVGKGYSALTSAVGTPGGVFSNFLVIILSISWIAYL